MPTPLLRGAWGLGTAVTKGTLACYVGERGQVFSSASARAIVGKANTPHSLTGPALRSGAGRRAKPAPARPWRAHKAALCCWGPRGHRSHAVRAQNQHPTRWAFQPLRPLSSSRPHTHSVWSFSEGLRRQRRCFWGAAALRVVLEGPPPMLSCSSEHSRPHRPFSDCF